VSEEDWWRLIGRRLGLDEATLAELIDDLDRREVWDEGLVDHLAAARRRARVVLVSNAWPDTRRRVERHGGDRVLDALVLSCEVGVAKPDEGIYTVALDRAGVAPSEAIFVDDIEVNVAAARRLGLTGHLHTGRDGTIEAIENFLARP
jgi:putative hydrolase of the HAD superfamily